MPEERHWGEGKPLAVAEESYDKAVGYPIEQRQYAIANRDVNICPIFTKSSITDLLCRVNSFQNSEVMDFQSIEDVHE
jgi:hypothetical protein